MSAVHEDGLEGAPEDDRVASECSLEQGLDLGFAVGWQLHDETGALRHLREPPAEHLRSEDHRQGDARRKAGSHDRHAAETEEGVAERGDDGEGGAAGDGPGERAGVRGSDLA